MNPSTGVAAGHRQSCSTSRVEEQWLGTGEGKGPPGLKAEPAWPPWGLCGHCPQGGIPTAHSSVPCQVGRGCRASCAHLGRLSSPGRGWAQVLPFLPGLGRQSPTWPYTGTELLPGMGRWGRAPFSLLPSLDTIQGFVRSQPGGLGLLERFGPPPPRPWGCPGWGWRFLEPGERDRDRSLLSPALSWRVSLGKQNDPPRIPSFPRLQVKKKNRETEARFGPGWCRKGKCSPKWGSCFSQWLVSGDEPLPSLQTVVPGQERAWSFHLPLVLHWSHSSAGWNWDRRVWNWSGSPRPAAPQPRVFPPPFPHIEPHGTRGGDFGSPLVLDFSRLRALAVFRMRVHPQSPWGRKRTRNVPPAAASWGAERLRVQMGKGFGP